MDKPWHYMDIGYWQCYNLFSVALLHRRPNVVVQKITCSWVNKSRQQFGDPSIRFDRARHCFCVANITIFEHYLTSVQCGNARVHAHTNASILHACAHIQNMQAPKCVSTRSTNHLACYVACKVRTFKLTRSQKCVDTNA